MASMGNCILYIYIYIIYRGLGDEESRSQFTFVSILGPKNIKKICVGGNHTWAILEEDCPLKVDYEPPVPLAAKVIPKKESKELNNMR